MELPIIETPLFPRWVWMEEITYSHIPIATLITAFMVLAPLYEYIGYRKGDLRYDRLARSMIWFAMILFSPGAALGTGIPVFIIGTYPEFWSRWSNLFFWPLVAQFGFFLLEVGFLFFGYYLSWPRWMNRKPLHITMGALAAFWGVMVQIVWDSLGGYMLTPDGVDLPAVARPVAWSAAAFFNPSFPLLFTHRFVGNISYTMLLTGGVMALRYMANKNPKEKAYFGWAADFCFTIGFLAFFAMPVIGWFYARVIQAQAPVAFRAIMGGHSGPTFTVKMGLIGLFLLVGGMYLFIRHKGTALRAAMTVGVLGLGPILLAHPPLRWVGRNPLAWRIACVCLLAVFIAAMWIAGRFGDRRRKRWQWGMFLAGLAAFFVFTLGGFVREASKNPYTVYQDSEAATTGIIKPEATADEKNRFLVYNTCLSCHESNPHPTAKDLRDWPGEDWNTVIQQHVRQRKITVSAEQARRIVAWLRERKR